MTTKSNAEATGMMEVIKSSDTVTSEDNKSYNDAFAIVSYEQKGSTARSTAVEPSDDRKMSTTFFSGRNLDIASRSLTTCENAMTASQSITWEV
jgi:hypothetical protein